MDYWLVSISSVLSCLFILCIWISNGWSRIMPRLGLFWKEALSCHLIFTMNSTCIAYYVIVITGCPNANVKFFLETAYVSKVIINVIFIRGWFVKLLYCFTKLWILFLPDWSEGWWKNWSTVWFMSVFVKIINFLNKIICGICLDFTC